mmetsp:Transcript_4861/g.10333  ORF Transcript_4861/g.10333 Transcript_4861/m.10333 type:complete len:118 (+) Transcript_4861:287-640(+)
MNLVGGCRKNTVPVGVQLFRFMQSIQSTIRLWSDLNEKRSIEKIVWATKFSRNSMTDSPLRQCGDKPPRGDGTRHPQTASRLCPPSHDKDTSKDRTVTFVFFFFERKGGKANFIMYT